MSINERPILAVLVNVLLTLLVALAGTAVCVAQFRGECDRAGGTFHATGATVECRY